MSDTSSQQPRPKIEVVRLPSNERAKLKPLLEGGVQLEAQFQHLRYGDYASCGSLEEKPCYRFRQHEYGNKPPLATKSCDNIFARQLAYSEQGQGSPFLWRDATRSEEHLCHTSHSLPRETSYRVHATSRIAVARSRITALLKKLSPRPRHKDSHTSSPCPCPWVVVEFSNPDLDSPDATGRSSSIASDHSFDLAVHATRMRREQAAKSQDQLQDKPSSAIIPQVSISASSSHSSQPSLASSRATPKKGEGMRYRSAAPTKLRSAYNMG